MFSIISSTIIGTVLSLFFLLPGFIFLRVFWGSDRGHLHENSIYSYLVWGTPISFFIYLVSFFFFYLINSCPLFNFIPSFPLEKILTIFLTPIPAENNNQVQKFNFNSSDTVTVITYFLVIDFLSYYFGNKLRDFIIKNYLDFRYPILKFRNKWFYILTAREFVYNQQKKGKVNVSFYVEVVLLFELGSEFVRYKGIIIDYELKDEVLEYIVLANVERTLNNSEIIENTSSINEDRVNYSFVFNVNQFSNGQKRVSGNLNTIPNAKNTMSRPNSKNPTDSKFYPIGNSYHASSMIFSASQIKNMYLSVVVI